ncbi:MAG: hypothetical protein ABIT01_11920 [Thermoanaerobaculia bacterium]
MRAAWRERERETALRDAALSWAKAGVIDAEALKRVEEQTPNAYRRVGPVFRALVFFFLSAAVLAFFGFCVAVGGSASKTLGLLSLLFAVALAVATELQLASPKLSAYGGAGGLSFWAGVFALVAAGWVLHEQDPSEAKVITGVLAVSTFFWGAACWRWGVWLFGLFSAVSFFLLLARAPQGRALWLVLGLLLTVLGARQLDRASLVSPHRTAFAAVLYVGLAAAYAAVNRYGLDHRVIEKLGERRLTGMGDAGAAGNSGLGLWAAFATAIFPLLVLVWGLRSRRVLVLNAGLVLGALSLVTLRFYIHVAPLWVILVVSGALLGAAALAIQRALQNAPDEELAGFTARALFRDEGKNLQVAAVVLAFTPARLDGPSAPSELAGEFRGGGGDSGGGGASGSF